MFQSLLQHGLTRHSTFQTLLPTTSQLLIHYPFGKLGRLTSHLPRRFHPSWCASIERTSVIQWYRRGKYWRNRMYPLQTISPVWTPNSWNAYKTANVCLGHGPGKERSMPNFSETKNVVVKPYQSIDELFNAWWLICDSSGFLVHFSVFEIFSFSFQYQMHSFWLSEHCSCQIYCVDKFRFIS